MRRGTDSGLGRASNMRRRDVQYADVCATSIAARMIMTVGDVWLPAHARYTTATGLNSQLPHQILSFTRFLEV